MPDDPPPATVVRDSRVRPLRVYHRDADLDTTVRRVIGYAAECECGWSGPRQATFRAARYELKQHRAVHENE